MQYFSIRHESRGLARAVDLLNADLEAKALLRLGRGEI